MTSYEMAVFEAKKVLMTAENVANLTPAELENLKEQHRQYKLQKEADYACDVSIRKSGKILGKVHFCFIFEKFSKSNTKDRTFSVSLTPRIRVGTFKIQIWNIVFLISAIIDKP